MRPTCAELRLATPAADYQESPNPGFLAYQGTGFE